MSSTYNHRTPDPLGNRTNHHTNTSAIDAVKYDFELHMKHNELKASENQLELIRKAKNEFKKQQEEKGREVEDAKNEFAELQKKLAELQKICLEAEAAVQGGANALSEKLQSLKTLRGLVIDKTMEEEDIVQEVADKRMSFNRLVSAQAPEESSPAPEVVEVFEGQEEEVTSPMSLSTASVASSVPFISKCNRQE